MKNKIYWILAIIIGIIIINQINPNLFSVGNITSTKILNQMPSQKINDCYSGKRILNIVPLTSGKYKLYLIESQQCKLALSKRSITTLSKILTYNPNVVKGQCWDGKTIIDLIPYGKKYKITYTEGCACELLFSNPGTNNINIYISIQDGLNSNAKQYAQFVDNILHSNTPFNKYSYTYYFQQNNYIQDYLNSGSWNKIAFTDSCYGIVQNYNCQNKIVLTLRNNGGLDAFSGREYIAFGKSASHKKFTILHEFGHSFGLWHKFDDSTDIMSYATLPSNAQFKDWEITEITESIREAYDKCSGKERYFSCNSIGDILTGCTQSRCTLTGGEWLPSLYIIEISGNYNIVKSTPSNDCLCKEGYQWLVNKGCIKL